MQSPDEGTTNQLKRTWVDIVWHKLELPLAIIFTHFITTALIILSLWGIDTILHLLKMDAKVIPGTSVLLSDLMLWLEFAGAFGVMFIGLVKAMIALVRS